MGIHRYWNKDNQMVAKALGREAAVVKSILVGMCQSSLAETARYSAKAPLSCRRGLLPKIPPMERSLRCHYSVSTSLPRATTTPEKSVPTVAPVFGDISTDFASTGLTETQLTRTNTSEGSSVGKTTSPVTTSCLELTTFSAVWLAGRELEIMAATVSLSPFER